MSDVELFLPDESATAALGAKLAPLLRRGDVVALSGPLGAGKTTLARGLIAALTGERAAPSPSFTLVAQYAAPAFEIRHFDLYRIERADEALELGLLETDDDVLLIEWPERAPSAVPDHALAIRLDAAGQGRRARLRGGGDWPLRLKKQGVAGAPESPKRGA